MANEPGQAWAERRVIIALAGSVAQRRAHQPSPAGWKRMLSSEQATCFHEAGHAVAAYALGWHAYLMTIDPPPLVVETGASVSAYCSTGTKPECPGGAKPTGVMNSDRRTAAMFCLVMGGNWKGALRCLRTLRATAADLVERNWESVKFLAYELEHCRQLDQAQIANILKDRG